MSLYTHKTHEHIPRNVNSVHKNEMNGFNATLAVGLTQIVGSMSTAYLFVVLALVGLLAILGWLSPLVALLVAWTSQTLIQLVLLPVIMVGQNVLSRKQELLADEQYKTTRQTYTDTEQLVVHMHEQDKELLRQTELIRALGEDMLKLQALLTPALKTREPKKPAVRAATKTELVSNE